MLVLTRRIDEAIIINVPGADIKIKILEVNGQQVRVGIEAPKECNIYRQELKKV